jgi:hypothetical protein
MTKRINSWMEGGRWLAVAVFAVGMAYVEAAVVLYLRTLGNRIDPYQPQPLTPVQDFSRAEVAREAATMIMLASVGWLAGRNARSRFVYFLIAFGVWDIFYYVFLKVLTGWPHSLLDWDVLFLIPLPWWGPVLAPACIAALMILHGTLLSQFERPAPGAGPMWKAWLPAACGMMVALYVFMADAIGVAGKGEEALTNLLPVRFNWPLFGAALALMSAPAAVLGWQIRQQRQRQPGAGLK